MKGMYQKAWLFFFCIRVTSSWIFHSQLPVTHFYSCFFFFAIYCNLLNSVKKSQNFIVTNFCIVSTLFHHKYIDKSFTKGSKKPVSLRAKPASPPAKPVFLPAKPVSLQGKPVFLGAKSVSLRAKPVSLPAKPVYWMQKFFKFLM